MSVADVVGEITGNQPTEQQMITQAQNTPSGTNPGPIYAPSSDPWTTPAPTVASKWRTWWCCSTITASNR